MAAFDFPDCERRLQQVIKTSAPCTSMQPPATETKLIPYGEISLSEQQLAILQEPLDPRVVSILREIGEDAEQIQNEMRSRRIIPFPFAGSTPGHAIRDGKGNWTVVSGEPPLELLRQVII
ncbi:MAG: hypothetical protein DLM73_01980 [Chthoniobacterales bacterium]|nr:MAG: hypothetical protein DLM73_01980 [Chthoniobacterales bacterium]